MRKQPEDREHGVSGNARQRRRVVRTWIAAGYRVRHYGGAGQFLLDVQNVGANRAAEGGPVERPVMQQHTGA